MKSFSNAVSTLLIFITIIVMPTNLLAEDLIDQSSNIFKFQKKLAMNGNVQAQYKLATMYETGDGIRADEEQAKHWYTMAADGGSESASHRLTYLDVKQNGYDSVKNKSWLDEVLKGYSSHNADSIYLLGQLYREGIGVEKDLNKSLELFNQVRILGNANVQREINEVRKEISTAREIELQKRRQAALALAKQQEIEDARLQAEALDRRNEKVDMAEAKQQELEEKRRQYEAVMKKIRMEQKLIDEQQAKVTGEENVSIDDEI